MRSFGPLNSSANDLEQSQIAAHRTLRALEIESYLRGESSGAKRNDFVSDMVNDHTLRIAVIQTREEKGIISASVSERSVTLLEQLCDSIGHLNSFFPNSPGLSGYQGSGTCDGPRKHHYDAAIRFANELFNEGQLEDIALENNWIAERNFEAAKKLDRILVDFRKGSSTYNNVMKELHVPYLPSDLGTGALLPIRLNGISLDTTRRSPLSELSIIRKENTYFEINKELLFQTISAISPQRSIAEKLVEVEKLLARIISNPDDQTQALLRQVFHQYLPGEIHGPSGKYSAIYFEELLNRLADAANTDSTIWNIIRPGLMLTLECGIYGPTDDLVPKAERKPILLRALERLPARLAEDQVLSILNEISFTKIPSIARDACSVFVLLPAEIAVTLLTNVMTTHQGPELNPFSEQTFDPFDSIGFANPEFVALKLLEKTFDATQLYSAQIESSRGELPQTLIDYTNTYLKLRASDSAVSGEFVDIDSALFPLLAKLDMKLFADRINERLNCWRGSKITFPLFANMIDQYFSSRFAEEVIEVLATQHRANQHIGVPYELIELIRDKWRVPRDLVTRIGGEELSAIIYRS